MRASDTTRQQKIKVLFKLFDFGITEEKELQKLSLENILAIPGITIPEMAVINEMQKQVRAGTLYAYLAGHASNENEN